MEGSSHSDHSDANGDQSKCNIETVDQSKHSSDDGDQSKHSSDDGDQSKIDDAHQTTTVENMGVEPAGNTEDKVIRIATRADDLSDLLPKSTTFKYHQKRHHHKRLYTNIETLHRIPIGQGDGVIGGAMVDGGINGKMGEGDYKVGHIIPGDGEIYSNSDSSSNEDTRDDGEITCDGEVKFDDNFKVGYLNVNSLDDGTSVEVTDAVELNREIRYKSGDDVVDNEKVERRDFEAEGSDDVVEKRVQRGGKCLEIVETNCCSDEGDNLLNITAPRSHPSSPSTPLHPCSISSSAHLQTKPSLLLDKIDIKMHSANYSSSSSSSNDDDDMLMISQELKSGFSGTGLEQISTETRFV